MFWGKVVKTVEVRSQVNDFLRRRDDKQYQETMIDDHLRGATVKKRTKISPISASAASQE